MLTVDDYGQKCRAFRDGMSIHARTSNHSQAKVQHVLANYQEARISQYRFPQ